MFARDLFSRIYVKLGDKELKKEEGYKVLGGAAICWDDTIEDGEARRLIDESEAYSTTPVDFCLFKRDYREGEKEMYKIQALVNGQWVDDAVGEPNAFETKQEALDMLPGLAKIFECPESEFRVEGEDKKMGMVIIASSRSRTTEVYRDEAGKLYEVYHAKSGRDIVREVPEIPAGLTVRYNPPIPAPEIQEYALE